MMSNLMTNLKTSTSDVTMYILKQKIGKTCYEILFKIKKF